MPALGGRAVLAKPTTISLDPVQDEILALSPLLYARLNQSGSQNPVDSSTHGRTMALNGTYTWGVDGPTADEETALRVAAAADIQLTSGRIAMTGSQTRLAFVKTTSTDATNGYDGNAALTIFGDLTANVWESFGIHNGKARYTRFNNSAWQTFDSTTSVNDGNWHLIAVTYNSSTLAVEIYVDGVDDGGGTMTAHQNQGGVNWLLVGYNSLDKYDGDIAHAALFGTVLTPQDIADIWAAREAMPPFDPPVYIEDGWYSYDYNGGSGSENVFYQAVETAGPVFTTDDSGWRIDTPEDPDSVLALIRYQQWGGTPEAPTTSTGDPRELRGVHVAFDLSSTSLDLKGGHLTFWIVKGGQRWHYTAAFPTAPEGDWAHFDLRLTPVDADWHNSWAVDSPNLEQTMAATHSYGIGIVGFSSEPTGELHMRNWQFYTL